MGKTYKIVMIRSQNIIFIDGFLCIVINLMVVINLMGVMILMVMMGRHGESEWNQQNRFCGWFDANLSETGIKVIDDHDDDVGDDGVGDDGDVQEAHAGGKALKDAGYKFDVAHTSVLQVTLLMMLMVSFTVTLKLFVKNRLKR